MRQILLSFIGFLIAFLSICQETLADGVEIHRGPIIYVSDKDTLRMDTVFYSHDPDGDDYYSKRYPKIWSNNDAISDSINTALGYTSYYEEFGDVSEFLGGYVTFDFDTWTNYSNHKKVKGNAFTEKGKIPVRGVYKDGYFELKIGKEKETRVFSPSVTKTSEWDNEWNGPYLYGNTTYVE